MLQHLAIKCVCVCACTMYTAWAINSLITRFPADLLKYFIVMLLFIKFGERSCSIAANTFFFLSLSLFFSIMFEVLLLPRCRWHRLLLHSFPWWSNHIFSFTCATHNYSIELTMLCALSSLLFNFIGSNIDIYISYKH